jgi:protein SOK2
MQTQQQQQQQPYPHSPYDYPPPPQDLHLQAQQQHQHTLDYRQPASPNYTHSPNPGMALPPMAAPIEQAYGVGPPTMDTTGQLAPPGMRPRLTTSVFEEEGSLCFQVDVGGICVARREGN